MQGTVNENAAGIRRICTYTVRLHGTSPHHKCPRSLSGTQPLRQIIDSTKAVNVRLNVQPVNALIIQMLNCCKVLKVHFE